MKITADFYNLAHIANLLGDHGYLPKEKAKAFSWSDAPTEIVIRHNTHEVAALLEENKGSVQYPYRVYTLSETTFGKRRKARRDKPSDGGKSSE